MDEITHTIMPGNNGGWGGTACRVLYAWFSTIGEKGFTPQMIRPGEWLTANVYAAAAH